MSTVTEIESALEGLPTAQMLEVAAWLDERRAMLNASEMQFQQFEALESNEPESPQRGGKVVALTPDSKGQSNARS